MPIQWKLTIHGFSVLHLAALGAGVEIMRILSNANLAELDPTQRNDDGDTPDDCFYRHRDDCCTIIREPYEAEETAWCYLMRCVCLQNNIDPETLGIGGIEDDTFRSGQADLAADQNDEAFVDAHENICD